jgi:transcription-repair coupling factor (superfamily II helicase)
MVNMAKDLLRLYALRDQAQRRPYSVDSPWQRQLEDSFDYQPTQDQLTAVAEIKKDLEGKRPMDRLLVGDVGFGKTEVALRAAFKVVQDGKQVAVLVPTTILAEQHYHVFLERMGQFPIKIAYLSRFVSSARAEEVITKLKTGLIDIVIGTHTLLGKTIDYHNLGLLIIDEEHRFGVAQKEQVKKLKLEIDVLTLSATPIPRTLNGALSKLRDISVLHTPPEGRQHIITNVTHYDEAMVRAAITTELKRGGQAYFLSNNVQTIYQRATKLKQLIPEARFGVVHGQLPGDEIEQIMANFLEHKFDVLVSTTIIASGLDIPNANTILIDNAHLIGLADLHQLRGRVGRSPEQAFAYFFYPQISNPTPEALDRLLAIYEFQSLGAGFDIAKKDLEIRGAGNLLGREQSGQLSLVGYELYVQLLSQAVDRLKKK